MTELDYHYFSFHNGSQQRSTIAANIKKKETTRHKVCSITDYTVILPALPPPSSLNPIKPLQRATNE